MKATSGRNINSKLWSNKYIKWEIITYIQVSRKFHSFKLCKVVTVILEKYNREMKCKKKLEKMRVIETMYCQMPFGLLKDVLNTLLF